MVIAASQVERWLQPTPNLTVADAILAFAGGTTVTKGAATGTATAAILAVPVVSVAAALATASIDYADDLELTTLVLASASVVFDNTAAVEDHLGVAACIALVPITAPGSLVAVEAGPGDFTLLTVADLAALVIPADAVVDFEDYGQGSIPIFGFTLPVLFTDNPYGYQTGDATVIITGVGYDAQAGGYADAVVPIITPADFSQKGNTPIFPFGWPIVFTAAANFQIGSATVALDTPADLVVDTDADAPAAITSVFDQFNPALFPWTLPVTMAA